MKLLHTADWHLGQKFINHERTDEHRSFLNWLTSIIIHENIDALIVAGDIFDITNPPHYARQLYYQFLSSLLTTSCKHILITGGNHDSPSMLDAPKELFKALRIHVVGSISADPKDDIYECLDENGKLEAVMVAVPFLRDRDLKYISAFESGETRLEQIKKGIIHHYEMMADLVGPYLSQKIPIIVTGHLYARGGTASDVQNNIYLGNMDNIDPGMLPAVFDYVALGHLHKAQPIGKWRHIRYSGSPIPLSFAEVKDKKSVTLVEFNGKESPSIRLLDVPQWRQLKTLQGSLESIQQQINAISDSIHQQNGTPFAWVEIIVQSSHAIPGIDALLQEFLEDKPVEMLKFRMEYPGKHAVRREISGELKTLTPLEVFRKRCEDLSDTAYQPLETDFQELLNWMQEKAEMES